MSRNVVKTMEKIFDRLISFITEENCYRISQAKRHIIAEGNEEKVFEFVKNAKILTQDKSTSICAILYEEKRFIVVEAQRGAIFEAMKFNMLNKENDAEVFQGAGMMAIALNYLPFRSGITEEIILDKCLSFDDEPDKTFQFLDIANFFEEYVVFELPECLFELKYEEDFQRLQALSITDRSSFFNLEAQRALQNLLLLNSSRSVAPTIVNSLFSNQWEYAFLQVYQCIEYLFTVHNAISLKNIYKLDLYKTIDALSDNIFKKNEKDSLIGVLLHADKLEKQQFWIYLYNEEIEDDGELTEKIASVIYKTRCNVAHLRFKQDSLICPDKELFMTRFVLLTYNIFQNMNDQINDICLKKSSWKKIVGKT